MSDTRAGEAPEALPDVLIDEGVAAEVRARLVRAVRRQCPSWLRSSLEDLVQTAFIRAVESLRRSGPSGPSGGIGAVPASYLEKAAYCALVDEIRRRRARPEAPLEDEVAERFSHHAPTPDAAHEAARAGRAIRDCLAGLIPARRQAVALVLNGHTVPATAGLLGFTLKKAENLVYRGMADLRACLRGKGFER